MMRNLPIKELIFSFILITAFQITINKPKLPETHAEAAIRPKAVKHIAKAKKPSKKAVKQAPKVVTVPKPAPVSANEAKAFIYQHESGNTTTAINPGSGACGLGQALPCSKMPCTLTDYACQDNFFTNYMLQRYGSWERAREFWLANNWW